MIKFIPALIILAFCNLTAVAQEQLIHPKEQTRGVSVIEAKPYVLANNLPTSRLALIVNRHSIKSMDVYKGQEAIAKFGEKAKEGAIVITMNPNVQLVRIKEIYRHFNVPAQQRGLKVCINNQLINNADLILADLKEVIKVDVIQQDITAPYRWSLDENEQFLNIITAEKI
jgi:hypothetical protein